MEPVVEKILQGIPFAGMGTALERNGLIGVVRELIKSNKYTVDYILNYCESIGYQRNMAEEVFEELTGLSPKLIINNNEYYNAPIYVPACTIAWGMAKSKPNVAFYVVPGSYGYSVMEKNETDVPNEIIQTATIPEAIDELKKVAKKIQTLDKIITSKLLEAEDIQSNATDPNQTAKPYFSDPVRELKKNFKNKVIDVNAFEREARKLVAEEKITLDEAEDLMNWEQDVLNEDDYCANEVLQHNEENKQLEGSAEIPFDNIYEEFKAISSEDEDILGGKEKAEILYRKNKSLFKDCDLLQCAERLYQLMLGFNKEEILGRYKFLNKTTNKHNKKITSKIIDLQDILDAINAEDVEDVWVDPTDDGLEIITYDNGKQIKDKFTREDIKRILNLNSDFYWNVDDNDEVMSLTLVDSKKQASKKVTAENMTLEDIEEEEKTEVEQEMDKINETPINELLQDTTPLDYFQEETQNDKVDTINDVVSKCITKFSDKFKDFNKYDVKMLSYKTKILDPYTANNDEMIPDDEVNADAILQVILAVNNKADDSAIKKLLVVFSITDGKMHWTGTVRDEDDNIIAFTEEGLDSIFEEPEEITEDII